MTDPLNAVAQAKAKRTDAEAKLVAAIVDASESGYTYRVIAKAAGLSHQRVAQIVKPKPVKGKVTA
jgi:predicted transcriptional regulator